MGNLPAIPPKHSWFKFKEWSEQFGPLYRLNIVGRNHVIVSTEKIANDLLRDRGAIYSSREELPMAAKLLSDGLRIVFIPYNGTPYPHSIFLGLELTPQTSGAANGD